MGWTESTAHSRASFGPPIPARDSPVQQLQDLKKQSTGGRHESLVFQDQRLKYQPLELLYMVYFIYISGTSVPLLCSILKLFQ